MRDGKVKEVEIDCQVLRQTAAAYLIFDGKREAWIPKSAITDYSEEKGAVTSIFISESLAIEKGLV